MPRFRFAGLPIEVVASQPGDLDDLAPIPHAPDSREKKTIVAMKDVVVERARELDLPEGLLCARRHLEALLATRQWPSALDGWRAQVLRDALLAKLPA